MFEVLEKDASQLKSLVGKTEPFGLDSRAFFGQLITLEPPESTVPALAMMRDRPTLRGVLEMYPMRSFETEPRKDDPFPVVLCWPQWL
jgi:hypothetical protein